MKYLFTLLLLAASSAFAQRIDLSRTQGTLPAARLPAFTGDCTIAQGTGVIVCSQFALKAPIASPTFTGIPAAPTAALGTSTTQLATTAFTLNQYAAPPCIGCSMPGPMHATTIDAIGGIATVSDLVHAGIDAMFCNTTPAVLPPNSAAVGAPIAAPGSCSTPTNPFTLTNAIQLPSTIVGSLPGAAAGNAGTMILVSDSTTVSAEGQTCVGGNTNKAIAISNGVVWKCF